MVGYCIRFFYQLVMPQWMDKENKKYRKRKERKELKYWRYNQTTEKAYNLSVWTSEETGVLCSLQSISTLSNSNVSFHATYTRYSIWPVILFAQEISFLEFSVGFKRRMMARYKISKEFISALSGERLMASKYKITVNFS